MVKTAWNFLAPLLLLALLFGFKGWGWAAGLCVTLAVFCAYFFRNPRRKIPGDPRLLVSPADGKVIAVEAVNDPFVGPGMEIRIFLNIFDVHVQRSPLTVPCRVDSTRYYAGKFLAAGVSKASLVNEQHWIRLVGVKGLKVVVKQIAGLIARRIVPWVSSGDELVPGQHLGLIQFGSQVDLVVPRSFRVEVKPGRRVRGGETIVARRPR